MKTKVLITIDTEFSSHKGDIGVFGEIAGSSYGLPLFMELSRKYNVKFTFFVDVYCLKNSSKGRLVDVCRKLIEDGHDLQLHTHPDGLFDTKRGQMCLYPVHEQIEIIRKGVELFKEWFGFAPIGHRAGDWAANEDTLNALLANNIMIDSSQFLGYRSCRLGENSEVIKKGQILEVPPTTYKINGCGMFKDEKLLSTDGNPFDEIQYVCRQCSAHDVPLINVVYHSFSFLKWNSRRTAYTVSKNEISKFERFMQFITEETRFTCALLRDVTPNDCIKTVDNHTDTGVSFLLSRVVDRIKR